MFSQVQTTKYKNKPVKGSERLISQAKKKFLKMNKNKLQNADEITKETSEI